MKSSLFVVIGLLFSITAAKSQISISLSPAYQLQDTVGFNLSDPWAEWVHHELYIHNTGTEDIDLQWTVITPENCPLDWGVRPSDEYQSYPTGAMTNYYPPVIDQPVALTVGDSTLFYINMLPMGQPGCCTYTIVFNDVNNPDTELPSAEIELRLNDPNCLFTSISETNDPAINIYPNPVRDWLFLDQPTAKEATISINDIGGKQVFQTDGSLDKIDVSALSSGLYFLRVDLGDQSPVQVFRFIKN